MRLIDEKGRLLGKVNIIDLCLVLVIALAIGGYFIKNNSVPKTQVEYKTITYTVEIKGIRTPTLQQFENKIGQALTIPKTGEFLGTVAAVNSKDSEALAIDKNGKYVQTTQPEKYDIILTIETQGTETSKGIFTEGGKQLFIGEVLGMETDTAETSGEILEIKVGE